MCMSILDSFGNRSHTDLFLYQQMAATRTFTFSFEDVDHVSNPRYWRGSSRLAFFLRVYSEYLHLRHVVPNKCLIIHLYV